MNGAKGQMAGGSVGGLMVAAAVVILQMLGPDSAQTQQGAKIAAQTELINSLTQIVQRHENRMHEQSESLASHQEQLTQCKQTMKQVLDALDEVKELRDENKQLFRKVYALLGWVDEQRRRSEGYDEIHRDVRSGSDDD